MLQANSITNCKEFHHLQGVVKAAVDTAKEEYVCRTACEAEKATKMVAQGGTVLGNCRWFMQGGDQID